MEISSIQKKVAALPKTIMMVCCWLGRLLSNYFRFTSMELYSNLQQLPLSIGEGDDESSFQIT
jgi:hypothetical protein